MRGFRKLDWAAALDGDAGARAMVMRSAWFDRSRPDEGWPIHGAGSEYRIADGCCSEVRVGAASTNWWVGAVRWMWMRLCGSA